MQSLGRPSKATWTPGQSSVQRGELQVVYVRTRASKELKIKTLKRKLDKSMLIMGINCEGFTPDELRQFRRTLPQYCELMGHTKKTLMSIAAQQTGRFQDVKDFEKGQAAYVFITEDGLRDGIKAWKTFDQEMKEMMETDKAGKPVGEQKGALLGACLDEKMVDIAELEALEKLPTKAEVIAKLLGQIKATPQKIVGQLTGVQQKLVGQVGELPGGMVSLLANAAAKSEDKSMTLLEAAQQAE